MTVCKNSGKSDPTRYKDIIRSGVSGPLTIESCIEFVMSSEIAKAWRVS